MFKKLSAVAAMEQLIGDEYRIAMEADDDSPTDLTAATNDAMKRASGKNADTGDLNPSRTSDETKSENADTTERGGLSDDLTSINPDDAETPVEGADDVGGDGPDDESGDADMGDDSGMDGNDSSSEDNSLPQESAEQAMAILKLQKNMTAFYQTLANMMDELHNYSAPASSPELRDIFNAAVDHISSAKEMMFDIASSKITPANYADKLRKYIALRHVYSVVLDMLRLHFQALDEESGVLKSDRNS